MRKRKRFKPKKRSLTGMVVVLGGMLFLMWQASTPIKDKRVVQTHAEKQLSLNATDATLKKLLLEDLQAVERERSFRMSLEDIRLSLPKEATLLEERAALTEPAVPDAAVVALMRLQLVDQILKKHPESKADALLFFNQCVEAEGVATEIRLHCYDRLLQLDQTEHYLAAVKVPVSIKRLAEENRVFEP